MKNNNPIELYKGLYIYNIILFKILNNSYSEPVTSDKEDKSSSLFSIFSSAKTKAL